MPPYIEEVGHDPGDSASGASAGGDVAAPVTDSPSPSPTPPSTPSPVMAQWHEDPTPPLHSDYLPTDHDLPRILREVSGTDDLVSVRSLRLRVISSDISLQRLSLYIPHLTSLDLDGSSINSLRDLGCSLMSLRVLKVGQCGLETLDGMFGLSSLRELHAPGNRVDDVGPCTSLPSIRLIDLARNNIEDISYVEFLAICQDLEELCLQGTPAAAQPNYRLTVYQLLPQLRTLDGIPLPSNLIVDEEPEPEQDEDSDDCDGAAGGGARPIGFWGPRSPCPGGSGASSRLGAGSPYPGPSTADTTECKTRALNLLNHGPLLTRRRKEELPDRPFTAPGGPMRPQLKPLKLTGTTQKSLQRSKRPKTALPSCGYETGSKDRLPPCRNSTPGWFRSSDSISGGLTSSHSPVSLRVCPNRQNITLSKTKCIGDRKPVVIESDYPLDPAQDILEASKRWRLMYRSFRAQHSNRWQKESDVLDSKSKLHPRPTDSVNDAEKSANLDQSFNEVSLPKLPKIV